MEDPVRALDEAVRALLVHNEVAVVQAHVDTALERHAHNGGLTPSQRRGLRDSGAYGADFESALADAVRPADAPAYRDVCYNQRNCVHQSTKLWRIAGGHTPADFARMRGVPLKVLDQHGYGADLFIIRDVDLQERTLRFVVVQIKGGRTPIHDSRSVRNQNSSMYFIATKLRHLRDAILAQLSGALPGWDITGERELWTTRSLRQVAAARAERSNIAVLGRTQLFRQVLTEPMRAYLRAVFGNRADWFGIE